MAGAAHPAGSYKYSDLGLCRCCPRSSALDWPARQTNGVAIYHHRSEDPQARGKQQVSSCCRRLIRTSTAGEARCARELARMS
jgi:hypothetical protein